MKIICLLFLLLPLSLFAQEGRNEISDPERLPFKEYNLIAQEPAPSDIKLPFSSIKIIDSRYDTSKIGFTHINYIFRGKKKSYKKLQLKGGLTDAIQKYFQDYFQHSFDSSGITLLVVIKKFWLSGIDNEKKKGLDVNDNLNFTQSMYCKWEYYLGKDGKYLPVKRVDTVWTLAENLDEHLKDQFERKHKEFLKSTLRQLIEMLDFSAGIRVFDQQNKKSMKDIITYNESRFHIPILKDGKFAEGVFMNFEEFKNNKPAIIHFKESKIKYGLIRQENFIEDENGKQINPYWGYYDGINFKYGRFGNDKLYRNGNTFSFFIKMVWYTYDSSPGTLMNKQRNEVWIPYEIDMETGEIY